MPKIQTNTKTFEDVLDAVKNKGLKVTAPNKGDSFEIGKAKCEVMTDSILNKDNLNLSSIVIRLEFENNSFLFMGDAETANEKTRTWMKTDVLKVGHHGSNTSSSEDFLKQINPTYAVIMAGKNNSYGLPKQKILDRLTKIGGHFGPNFGFVEATIAMHYVFNSPVDKFVFDVSHQIYPHKMLTGRKEGYFDENHYLDISGYSNPEESEHDFFTVGHTSTSISLACGLAKARDLKNDKENIVAVIGDGSLSGGESLEGLDFAGSELNSNFIIVVMIINNQ